MATDAPNSETAIAATANRFIEVSFCAGIGLLTVDPGQSLRPTRATHALHPFAQAFACSPSILCVPRGPPVQRMRCTLISVGANHRAVRRN
jgi:hypothetical protein